MIAEAFLVEESMMQHVFENDSAELADDSELDRRRYDYDRAYDDWLKRNPIRQRRIQVQVWARGRSKVLSQNALATKLKKAPLTVQNWESGAVTPKPEGFAKLAAFFGDADIEQEWHNWHRQQPESPMPQLIQEEIASEDSAN